MRARRSGDDRRRREGLGSRMRPELGVAAHAEPGPRRPKRVGGLRLDVDLRAEEGRHGDARKQPLVAEHGMGLGCRPEVGCVEAAADRGAADADAAHGDEAVAIERAGESALQAGAQKGGPAAVELPNRTVFNSRGGAELSCANDAPRGGKRAATASAAPALRARTFRRAPLRMGRTTPRQLWLQCSAAPARSARGKQIAKGTGGSKRRQAVVSSQA